MAEMAQGLKWVRKTLKPPMWPLLSETEVYEVTYHAGAEKEPKQPAEPLITWPAVLTALEGLASRLHQDPTGNDSLKIV